MTDWRTGTPAELIRDLRPGGWCWGHSGRFTQMIQLSKGDMLSNLRKLPEGHSCVWRVHGNPVSTGRYDKDRRTIVIFLGK